MLDTNKSTKSILQKRRAWTCGLIALLISILLPYPALSNAKNSMAVNVLPPGQTPADGAPPPPGSGDTPAPVTHGDADGSNTPPPSGIAESGYPGGSRFEHRQMSPRGIVNILNDVPDPQQTFGLKPIGDSRPQPGGQHVVLTFRPDTLTDQQRAQVQGALGSLYSAKDAFQNISASEAQIEQLQKILYPYTQPGKQIPNSNNTSRLATSLNFFTGPGYGYQRYQPTQWFVRGSGYPDAATLGASKLSFKSQLITVRPFCRYLVLLGVVFASVYMILAAYAMVQGQRGAGARVTAAAGGLMLLLMSYSIWKIVVTNSNRFPDTADQARNPRWRQPGDTSDQNESTYIQSGPLASSSATRGNAPYPSNTTPSNPNALLVGAPRSNMLVQPMGASINR